MDSNNEMTSLSLKICNNSISRVLFVEFVTFRANKFLSFNLGANSSNACFNKLISLIKSLNSF